MEVGAAEEGVAAYYGSIGGRREAHRSAGGRLLVGGTGVVGQQRRRGMMTSSTMWRMNSVSISPPPMATRLKKSAELTSLATCEASIETGSPRRTARVTISS